MDQEKLKATERKGESETRNKMILGGNVKRKGVKRREKGKREKVKKEEAGKKEKKEGEGERKEVKKGKEEERKEKNDNYVIIEKDGNQIVDYMLPEEAGVYPGQGDTHICFVVFAFFPTAVLGVFYN